MRMKKYVTLAEEEPLRLARSWAGQMSRDHKLPMDGPSNLDLDEPDYASLRMVVASRALCLHPRAATKSA